MFDWLKRSIAGRYLRQLDAAGLKRWPVGWIKVRRAAMGWKVIIGALVFYSPDILMWANANLPGLLPAIGVEDATPVLKFLGATLAAIGGIHKALKFFGPVDRRLDVRKAAVIEDAGWDEKAKETN